MKNEKIRILLVEDESPLIKNLHKKIEALSDDFLITGDAFNGKEALQMIQDTKPDIVLTDIKMPIMDGLELARIIYENYSDITTVIISGYDDFEYARKVLTYRVYDYLLKPLQTDALKKLLEELKTEIIKRKTLEKNSLLSQLLHSDHALDAAQMSTLFPVAPTFSLFLIHAGNLHLHTTADDTQSRTCLHSAVSQALSSNAPFDYDNYWLFAQTDSKTQLLLLQDLSADPKAVAEYLFQFLQTSMEQLPVTIVYQKDGVAPEQLFPELILLKDILVKNTVIGKSALISADVPEQLLPPAVLSKSSIQYFHAFLLANDPGGFASTLKSLFELWAQNEYPQNWISKLLIQLMNLMQQDLYFSNEDYLAMFQEVFVIFETQTDLLVSGRQITDVFLKWIQLTSAIPSEIQHVIEELDAFIRSNYRDNLMIAELAEKYHFNQSYLSRVFKKQMGISPVRLMISLRIQDAQELLLQSELSIRKISELLGFSDQHYFSRSFKNVTGLSPNDYRNLHSDKGV